MAAAVRLAEERKNWRKDHPFGFVAKPRTKSDGSVDLTLWDCEIPGKEGTSWEGGSYPLTMVFPKEYPMKAPRCSFPPGFFHPNVYPDGKVCLSIINDDTDLGGNWAPSITVKQILLGIQELLHTPNINSAAQPAAYYAYKDSRAKYDRLVREQARKYTPSE